MPRLKNKPIELNEDGFIDWLLEVYYYRFLDQGVGVDKTPLMLSAQEDLLPRAEFFEMLRTQLTHFDLTFPLTKVPYLFRRALREISTTPAAASPEERSAEQDS